VALNANVLATVLLPVTLVFLILLANDRELMGDEVNRRATNWLAVVIAVFISLAGGAYGVESFLASVHVLS
jgi:Mn2+/Fe2+ NRAMP family transporter